jgi:hypothetical protein
MLLSDGMTRSMEVVPLTGLTRLSSMLLSMFAAHSVPWEARTVGSLACRGAV